MEDIMSFVQGAQETQNQFDNRRCEAVKRNIKKLSTRLSASNENAEEHYDRFMLYQHSANGYFTLHSPYRDDFLNHKRQIYKAFDKEIINTMKKKFNSPEKQLDFINSVMVKYSDIINNERDDISETMEERISRISKFQDIRGDIKLEQALITEKNKSNNTIAIEEAKEMAREKIRNKRLIDNSKNEQERKRKKLEQFEKKKTIQISVFLFLVTLIFLIGSFLTSLV